MPDVHAARGREEHEGLGCRPRTRGSRAGHGVQVQGLSLHPLHAPYECGGRGPLAEAQHAHAQLRARRARRTGAGQPHGPWLPPAPTKTPRRATKSRPCEALHPLRAPHGAPGLTTPLQRPSQERNAHAGRVHGVGAVDRSRPRTRGAHVKARADSCWLIFTPPVQKLAASPAASPRPGVERGAAGRPGGHGAARRPSPAAPSARTWSPGCSPKGVDHARASPHHVAHIPAHPAPLRPRPPARAPRRVGARGQGAQQPLLGP